MLTFLHEGATGTVIKNLRSAQARLQFAWIRMFFESISEPKNFKGNYIYFIKLYNVVLSITTLVILQ